MIFLKEQSTVRYNKLYIIWLGLKCNNINGKIKVNFSSFKSIYDYDNKVNENAAFPENISLNDNTKKLNKYETTSWFLDSKNKFINNSINSNDNTFRDILLTENMNDLHILCEKNMNELKNYEYIYILFKIYDIIFTNFYKTYEFSETLILENPNFEYMSFFEYVDSYLKKGLNSTSDGSMRSEKNYKTDNKRDSEKCKEEVVNKVIYKDNILEEQNIKHVNLNINNGKKKNIYTKFVDTTSLNKIDMSNTTKNVNSVDSGDNIKEYMYKLKINLLIQLYVNYILYLEDMNIKDNVWKEYLNFFMTDKYEKFYQNILNVINKKIFHFSCIDIINFLYILKRTRIILCINDLSCLVHNLILGNLKYLENDNLVKVSYIYLNNDNKKKSFNSASSSSISSSISNSISSSGSNKQFLETFINYMENKIKDMNNNDFIKLLVYINNNNYKHIQFYKNIKIEIYKRYYNFTEEQLIKLFYLYSQNLNAADDFLMQQFMDSIIDIFDVVDDTSKNIDTRINNKNDLTTTLNKNSTECNKKEKHKLTVPISVLLNLIWANAKHFKNNNFVLKKCEQTILKNIHNFSCNTISMLIWAYSTVENKNKNLYFDIKLYFKLKEIFFKVYKDMTPKQLTNSILGLSTTIGRIINDEGYIDLDLHIQIEDYVLGSGSGSGGGNKGSGGGSEKKRSFNFLYMFTGEDLSNLCFSYALVRSGSKAFHTLIQSALLNKITFLSPQDITKIAYTYGTLYSYASYTLLCALQYEIIQRIHQFNMNEICDILWCYCINKFYDANFWKCLLHVIDFDKIYNPRYCLLYASLSFINLIDPSILDSYNVLKIFNLLRDFYWEVQNFTYPHKFANDVLDTIDRENDLILSNKKNGLSNQKKEDYFCVNTHQSSMKTETGSSTPETSNKKMFFKNIQKVLDYEGFLIDIYFEYQNQQYAVFLSTPLNTTNNGYPLGDYILKNRYIKKKKKFKTIHLVYDIWKKSGHEKMELIYAQL
ncbi:conserved protein, unknown function [Hepatocystis sp. ex Piliocolobus tephrosceles]|nr:conserved protein, unknown function [Hepatocystis sp. ex Piliocolobus tephrosceles]